jgi:hypothetical protein
VQGFLRRSRRRRSWERNQSNEKVIGLVSPRLSFSFFGDELGLERKKNNKKKV